MRFKGTYFYIIRSRGKGVGGLYQTSFQQDGGRRKGLRFSRASKGPFYIAFGVLDKGGQKSKDLIRSNFSQTERGKKEGEKKGGTGNRNLYIERRTYSPSTQRGEQRKLPRVSRRKGGRGKEDEVISFTAAGEEKNRKFNLRLRKLRGRGGWKNGEDLILFFTLILVKWGGKKEEKKEGSNDRT